VGVGVGVAVAVELASTLARVVARALARLRVVVVERRWCLSGSCSQVAVAVEWWAVK
jgi:hypothetical protein